jgi:hypothetical protein
MYATAMVCQREQEPSNVYRSHGGNCVKTVPPLQAIWRPDDLL